MSDEQSSNLIESNLLTTIGELNLNDVKPNLVDSSNEIQYIHYESEKQMPDIMSLIEKDLSEPYSIYTYRYFIHNWPTLCFLVIMIIFNICLITKYPI